MALDPRSRQKKIERRKAKEKSKERAQKEWNQRLEAQTVQAISTAPILHCCAIGTIFERGFGQVLISRELPNRKVAFASILLDLYCLGAKDAMFHVTERGQYDRQMYGHMTATFETVTLKPACARKLIEGAVEYARNLDFQPHPDYSQAKRIFGDIDPAACEQTFVYGKDGKPFYIAGPNDSSDRCTRIMRSLHTRCGPGGYHFLAPIELMDSLPAEIQSLENIREI
ncbi:MAG: hypothetical protein EXS05_09000 [Planctomycetaceae bacterium]|nr:hypothetical protein [Planctomycetaceae bacterium]